LEDMKSAVRETNPNVKSFDASCFDGVYVTGDITAEYLDAMEAARSVSEKQSDDDQMELDLAKKVMFM